MADPVPIQVVADVYERRSEVPDALSRLGAAVTIEACAVGDYRLSNACIVERKFVLDLHLSVLQGRLWPQLWRLRTACSSPFLLVEGADLDEGPLSAEAIRGAHSRRKRRDPRAAAELLLAAAPGISFVSARALLDRFGSVAAVASASTEDLLTVPGIGTERARTLAQTLHASRRRTS